MIDWKPIESEFNLIGSSRIYTDGHCINDRPHLLPRPATHWATANLPGDPQDLDMAKSGIEEYAQQEQTT